MSVTNNLKLLYERIPKSVKYAFAPIFIRLMVKNKEFVKTWKALDEFEALSVEEQKRRQFIYLKETLVYAYEHVPYYRELFEVKGFNPRTIKKFSDIKVLPILEKADAIALEDKIYSDDRKLKYYKTFTGGSSGKALTVLLDKDSIYKERACVTHFLSKFGYDPMKTKSVVFWGHNKDKDYYYSPLKNEIVISPFQLFDDNQLENICSIIKKFGADFIMGYPSAIYLFAQMLEKSGKKIQIRHVVYYAENCSQDEKRYIERVMKCPVDSYYGHTERACFAQIQGDNCVFSDYYGYTELLPTEVENEYRIACTGFLNKKMPLIRYATDDIIHINENGIMCLQGHKRSEVYLLSKNGHKIFKGAMTLHIEELKKVHCYQYVQSEIGKAELRIVQDIPLSKEEVSQIKAYIERRCENLLDIEIKIVDSIELTSRGKYIWAVNHIEM